MSRLIHRLLREGFRFHPAFSTLLTQSQMGRARRVLMQELERAELIVADNVAEYLYSQTDQEIWDIRHDFPCVAPPFERFFIEFRHPHRVLSESHGTFDVKDEIIIGCLFEAIELPSSIQRDGSKWAMHITTFEEVNGACILSPVMYGNTVTEQGAFCSNGIWGVQASPGFANVAHGLTEHYASIFFVPFLTLSFLHCKNVKYVEEQTPSRLRHSYEKKAGRAMIRVHTLEITPLKQILRREGASQSVGLKRALHICRGHFKDYRERGLFGRVKGVFWWDSCVRGSAGAGIDLHDYQMNKPGEVVF